MDIFTLLEQRYTCRGFLPKPVLESDLKKILSYALKSPSGTNAQPVYVAFVDRQRQDKIKESIINLIKEDLKDKPDYEYYPSVWKEPYKSRRFKTGLGLYEHLGIKKDDKSARLEQWLKNYNAFNAPTVAYIFIDKSMSGFMLDAGIFVSSFILCAKALGIDSCVLGSLAEYPNVVRDELGINDNMMLVCGIGLGYEDKLEKANSFKTTRVGIDEMCSFFK